MSLFFGIVFFLGVLAFAAGMIKPVWVMRWSVNPTRRKLAVVAIPLLLIVSALADRTRSPEEITRDVAAQKQKEAARLAEEAPQRARQASRDGVLLYDYYKNVDGNQDRSGFDEQQYVKGQLLSKCNVNGKPRGYYGWIDFRTVFLQGYRLKDAPITHMYVFAVDSDSGASVIWRGEKNKQAVFDNMQQTCD